MYPKLVRQILYTLILSMVYSTWIPPGHHPKCMATKYQAIFAEPRVCKRSAIENEFSLGSPLHQFTCTKPKKCSCQALMCSHWVIPNHPKVILCTYDLRGIQWVPICTYYLCPHFNAASFWSHDHTTTSPAPRRWASLFRRSWHVPPGWLDHNGTSSLNDSNKKLTVVTYSIYLVLYIYSCICIERIRERERELLSTMVVHG